jgi:hypothetical protein
MSNQPEPALMIRLEEAHRSIDLVDDERLRAFMRYGLTTVLLRRGVDSSVTPQAAFDLRFYVEVLRAIGGNRDVMLRILQGDVSEMEWWSEAE